MSDTKPIPDNIQVNLPERKMESLADIMAAQDDLKRKLQAKIDGFESGPASKPPLQPITVQNNSDQVQQPHFKAKPTTNYGGIPSAPTQSLPPRSNSHHHGAQLKNQGYQSDTNSIDTNKFSSNVMFPGG